MEETQINKTNYQTQIPCPICRNLAIERKEPEINKQSLFSPITSLLRRTFSRPMYCGHCGIRFFRSPIPSAIKGLLNSNEGSNIPLSHTYPSHKNAFPNRDLNTNHRISPELTPFITPSKGSFTPSFDLHIDLSICQFGVSLKWNNTRNRYNLLKSAIKNVKYTASELTRLYITGPSNRPYEKNPEFFDLSKIGGGIEGKSENTETKFVEIEKERVQSKAATHQPLYLASFNKDISNRERDSNP